MASRTGAARTLSLPQGNRLRLRSQVHTLVVSNHFYLDNYNGAVCPSAFGGARPTNVGARGHNARREPELGVRAQLWPEAGRTCAPAGTLDCARSRPKLVVRPQA